MSTAKSQGRRTGVDVDVHGAAIVDPTANVLQLVEAAIRRQDDLRYADERLAGEQQRHLKELLGLRSEFSKEMRQLETERINAIRQVDVTAVRTEADRALVAIQTLAAQTATDREKLRTDVAVTAQTIAKQTSDTVGQLNDRIAALERTSYEGKGKEAVSDPMMAQMVAELKLLSTTMTRSTGKGEGIEKVWGWIVAAAGSGGVLAYLAAHFTK
jgi:hypothetical protein